MKRLCLAGVVALVVFSLSFFVLQRWGGYGIKGVEIACAAVFAFAGAISLVFVSVDDLLNPGLSAGMAVLVFPVGYLLRDMFGGVFLTIMIAVDAVLISFESLDKIKYSRIKRFLLAVMFLVVMCGGVSVLVWLI